MVRKNDENPTYEGTVTREGRLSLPREVREAGFEPGTRVYIHVETDGELKLVTRDQKAARLRATINEHWEGGDEPVSNELAADRRKAAREENKKHETGAA